ncbi:MAG: phosphatase PAP2 family protein [bacterium]
MTFELDLIHWLQSFSNGFFDTLFQFFTMFGEELVIIAALGFLYWCYDKKTGEYVGVTVFVSLFLNSTIKTIVQRPRPYVQEPYVESTGAGIRNIRPDTAGGYAFPSGHTQGAATVFSSLSFWLKKRWLTIVSAIIIGVVALSRMYLGAHYLTDVLVGAGLGVFLAYFFHRYFTKHGERAKKMYLYIAGIGVVVAAAVLIYHVLTIEATTLLTNAENLYDKMKDSFTMVGAMIGFVIGIHFEAIKVQFVNHRIWWKNLIRFIGGVAIVMGVRLGLKAIFGLIVDGEELAEGQIGLAILAVMLDGIRYFAMVFIGIGAYPYVFRKWKF